jgi:hypothetical protein
MSDDNPYAAPQTLETRAALPVAQPAAANHARRMFSHLSTKELAWLTSASRAIQRMTIISGLLFAIALSLSLVRIMERTSLIILMEFTALCGLLGLRIYAGVVRGRVLRYFSLLIDLSISVVSIYFMADAMLVFRDDPSALTQFLRVGISFFLINLAMLPCLSVYAQVRYPQLFGEQRYPHEDLLQELKFRRLHQIS